MPKTKIKEKCPSDRDYCRCVKIVIRPDMTTDHVMHDACMERGLPHATEPIQKLNLKVTKCRTGGYQLRLQHGNKSELYGAIQYILQYNTLYVLRRIARQMEARPPMNEKKKKVRNPAIYEPLSVLRLPRSTCSYSYSTVKLLVSATHEEDRQEPKLQCVPPRTRWQESLKHILESADDNLKHPAAGSIAWELGTDGGKVWREGDRRE